MRPLTPCRGGTVCDPISSFLLRKEETVSPAKEERTLCAAAAAVALGGSARQRRCFSVVDLTLPPTAAAALWDAFAMLRV